MITRLYVDNFRALVNFEWAPGKLALLLGDNGSGKSTLLDVLRILQRIVGEGEPVDHCLPNGSTTRWNRRTTLTFELDLDDLAPLGALAVARLQRPEGPVRYRLVVEDSSYPELGAEHVAVAAERLEVNGRTIFDFSGGELKYWEDDGTLGLALAFDGSRSGIAWAASAKRRELSAFSRWMRDGLSLLRPSPPGMTGDTRRPSRRLQPDLCNFASWYADWVAEDLDGAARATDALRAALPGFQQLRVVRDSARLVAAFEESGLVYEVDFESLSDGQRALCALYVLRHAILRSGRLVILDEPDNFVALPEIQPWLIDVVEAALSEAGPQVWFISHHPALLDLLAPDSGWVLSRRAGPARIRRFAEESELPPSEVVARRWLDD